MAETSYEIKKKIVKYANKYFRLRGFSPSVREIAAELGIGKSTVHNYLVEMNDEGMVEYNGKDIVTYQFTHCCMSYFSAPVIGNINCGNPEEEEEEVLEYVRLPETIFGHGEFYILVASGDSMVDAGIDDGDYVVIERTPECKPGDIVVALVSDNENTLKCYTGVHNGKAILEYMNEDVYPGEFIDVDNLVIQGVARTVIKKAKGKFNSDFIFAK
ncbi:MAG: helix-turn-helix domain-containing protein [Clostridia bacterium]|nr:helix-turn-helix domain-containing protein [Clostridia bacterium]